jgi:hypothetical protein
MKYFMQNAYPMQSALSIEAVVELSHRHQQRKTKSQILAWWIKRSDRTQKQSTLFTGG